MSQGIYRCFSVMATGVPTSIRAGDHVAVCRVTISALPTNSTNPVMVGCSAGQHIAIGDWPDGVVCYDFYPRDLDEMYIYQVDGTGVDGIGVLAYK